MTMRDLVLLARGPKVGADLQEAEIARMPADRSQGQLAQTVRVPMDSTYLFERDSSGRYFGPPGLPAPASGTPDVPLQPYDNVLILRQPDFELEATVWVGGEVRFPGSYTLTAKDEHLDDIVRRAGGLTPQAYTEGIRFYRTVDGVGRINVDLARALADSKSRDNVVVLPYDSILVPRFQPSVKISGAVNTPGSVMWRKGADLSYYIGESGGFTYKADKGRVSVEYANGDIRTRHGSLFGHHDPVPGPGSEISVPTKDPAPNTEWITLASAVAGILSSTVALVVLLHQL